LPSVLVVEDDPFICVGLEVALSDAGYQSLKSACSYRDALAAIDSGGFDYCILDLDLGNSFSDAFLNEPAGKRLLAVLQSRGVSTVIYSGILGEQRRITDLDPSVITIDKTEPAEIVIEALSRMGRSTPSKPVTPSVTSTP
jgi:DNA-binding NarL/FixJ family response regulator